MATRKPAVKKAAPKVVYLEQIYMDADQVAGKDHNIDNVDYLRPLCVDGLEDGDVVAVYQFSGLKKVNKGAITLTDVEG